jgi:D-lactate dehydrogenase
MALLTPQTERILPTEDVAPPAADRAPDALANGTPVRLRDDLSALVGEDRLLTRVSDLVRYASDASPYRRFPQVVVQPRNAREVSALLGYGRREGVPVTLRSAGTSLNGQSQGDGIMLDVRRHWRGVTVEEDGARARVRPGTSLGYANRVLARHGTRLGPDPASSDTATVGGVVANNSGGMRCGVTQDSYSTVRSMTFVLPSGTLIDTAAPDAAERFAAAEPELAAGLAEIRDEIRADEELVARIRHKFSIKNTTGYRLCAFLDADEPVEIFRRLLIGSEGTLAFTAEVVFDTVPVPKVSTVSWVHFPSIDEATKPVTDLVALGATAVELMVAPALMVASHSIAGTPESWRELPLDSAVLLVEFGAEDEAGLDAYVAQAEEIFAGHELIRPTAFTRDHEQIELAWTVREGLHGLIGRLRPPGSSLIVEDVCVPPARMAESARDIQALLTKHGFLSGVAGHASAGNLHFMLTPVFGQAEDRERYEAFMAELVDLIVDTYDGSLKAEHGTGINMAPFVEREWGEKATSYMWRLKALADPDGVMNPGVILNRDPDVHLRDLKTSPAIEESATTCVECGFCEPVCPSRDLTTTPRQRIVLRRELARQAPGSPVQRALLEEFEYDVLQTCAADGICKLSCPLGIDTGKMVKELREREVTDRAGRVALETAKRWGTVEKVARGGLKAGETVGGGPLNVILSTGRRVTSPDLVPSWPDNMPAPAAATLPPTVREGAAAVYLPACINRIFGAAQDEEGVPRQLPDTLVAVSARAGKPVWIPPDVSGVCCGVPFSSKGYLEAHRHMVEQTAAALVRWSDNGALPIVIDASSCAQGLIEDVLPTIDEDRRPVVLDSIAWAHDELLPGLEIHRTVARVAVHPPCSCRHLGLTGRLEAIAGALADEVDVPISATCCGFAGDRGLLHPELPRAATAPEAAELAGVDYDAALSSNRTCEIGLQQTTGDTFASFLFLLDDATRP